MAVKLKEHLQVLHEKCPYSELFWSEFSRIRTEYEEILRISQYSVQMRENTDQNNSEYGHFLRSEIYVYFSDYLEPSLIWSDGNMVADQVKNMCFDWSKNCGNFFCRELIKSILTILKRNISPL